MAKWIEEFRRSWQGFAQPSPLFSIGFAASCLVLATLIRWCLALIRPDVFFTPYFPAVFFAAALGGLRVGIATALVGGALGMALNFNGTSIDSARIVLLAIFLAICGLTLWGIEHYRSVAIRQRDIAKRLIQAEEYRKLVVDELQHRLKNKLSVVHAVLHQVLHDQPAIWATIDGRIRALSATDDLIARVD
ncbi:MAG TPA: HWE histidine kinase domain-containing protein, partial [Bradyrhizobium sp.]|nr:HWE histidine kinase domain-containing protein [Bradyrhizobium sp.]